MGDEWTTASNGATNLRLVGNSHARSAFHPAFTYPIFGNEEVIYGYQDLSLHLDFLSGSLKPFVAQTYGSKNERTAAKVDEPLETLLKFLPGGDPEEPKLKDKDADKEQVVVCDSRQELQRRTQEAAEADADFQPPGQKTGSWTLPASASASGGSGSGAAGSSSAAASAKDREFEVYRCTWTTPGFKQFQRRMRIFTLFFIEAASYLDEDEPAWEFYLVFEREAVAGSKKGRYHYVGFTSLYQFWFYPEHHRVRLSQFLILPPYQGIGLGSRLYTHAHDQVLKRGSKVAELTIEDPGEIFDRLRDSADLKRLLNPGGLSSSSPKLSSFADGLAKGKLLPPVNAAWSEARRKEFKIPPRQWYRLVEMIQLMYLDPANAQPAAPAAGGSAADAADSGAAAAAAAASSEGLDRKTKDRIQAYRMQVKARLFKQNRDILTQVEPDQRKRKLQETYENVVQNEYADLVGVDPTPFLGGVDLSDGEEDDDEEEEEEEEDEEEADRSGKGKGKSSNGHGGHRPFKVQRVA